MTVRDVESRMPHGLSAADLGEATAEVIGPRGERFVLVSYLTSPLVVRTKLDYVLFALPPAGSNEDLWLEYVSVASYKWTVLSKSDASFIEQSVTDNGCWSWTAQAPGTYTTRVEARDGDGKVLATLSLTQTVTPRDARLEEFLRPQPSRSKCDAIRELVNDLSGYINQGAAATGPTGIPARLLAGVVFMEAWGRPKEGTANAKAIRARAGGKDDPDWLDWTEDQLAKRGNREFGAISDIRCVEIQAIAEVFQDRWVGRLTFVGPTSMGVAQIQMAVAAMVLGMTAWREKPPGGAENAEARKEIDDSVEEDWRVLPRRKQVEIFNHLRFPKTNIALCAKLLARIKERPNRALGLPVGAVAANAKLVGLIATEFNAGATTSSFDEAKVPEGNTNGQRAIQYVKDGSVLHPELYFP
ncbi:hypothetical protein [Hamadaea tsunoensis]|uniref:hypothetical protein n=1 Tax=Hamadaea tsunoensis TaxID=53368 RepID=UPI00042817C0|nr:hypothetical protein [Hamadaea tsunoensis]